MKLLPRFTVVSRRIPRSLKSDVVAHRARHNRFSFLVKFFLLIPGLVVFWATCVEPQDSSNLIPFLNQVIDWYHEANSERQLASGPGDVMTVSNNARIADEVLRLAFEYARAELEFTAPQAGTNGAGDQSVTASRYQSLLRLSAKLDQQIQQGQTDLGDLRKKLEISTGQKRKDLESAIAEQQSELDLSKARRDMLHNMEEFVNGAGVNGMGVTGIRAQVEGLARSLPPALTEPSSSSKNGSPDVESSSAVPSSMPNSPPPSGIWGLTTDLFANFRSMRRLDKAILQTEAVKQRSRELRSPLVSNLRDLSRRADEIANRPDSTDPNVLAQQKKDLDTLTLQFKQMSSVVMPLSKQSILLDVYSKSLSEWRDSFRGRYYSELRSVLLRVVSLVLILALIVGVGELWRKTILRYVRETRRRDQFLLLRRIVIWCAIGIIIAFSFANQLGSVATFAGLLTAGVAVALQNVILSIGGYFFLIGKYGIRVGDRVQIAGITGEVLDIGLVRLHLLELGPSGAETPSGRVVAFSNSIVFQPAAGLFKQIPGTHFVWHEVTLSLSPESDYHAVEKRLLSAVERVFADYHDIMEQQRRQLERALRFSPVAALRPRSRLRFTSTGVEIAIQYPVDLAKSGEIDDRVTRELLKAIDQKPRLNLLAVGSPEVVQKSNLPS